MFCRVYNTDDGTVIMLNPNCNMKLIYEYLRVMTDIPDSYEIDLCGSNGQFLGIYDAECSARGLNYLVPRSDYFIFKFDYDERTGKLYNPQPAMPYSSELFKPVLMKMKKFYGISKNEAVNQEDAALLFEHMLTAYQEKLSPVAGSVGTRASSTLVPARRKHSKSKSISKNNPSVPGQSVFQRWRDEKRASLIAARPEVDEEEESFDALGALAARKSTKMNLPVRKNVKKSSNKNVDTIKQSNNNQLTKKNQSTKKSSNKKIEKTLAKKEWRDDQQMIPSKRKETLQQAAPTEKLLNTNTDSVVLEPTHSLHAVTSSHLHH